MLKTVLIFIKETGIVVNLILYLLRVKQPHYIDNIDSKVNIHKTLKPMKREKKVSSVIKNFKVDHLQDDLKGNK